MIEFIFISIIIIVLIAMLLFPSLGGDIIDIITDILTKLFGDD